MTKALTPQSRSTTLNQVKVSAQDAQEHFADILTAIDTGEQGELTRSGQPSLRLIPV